jgi:hypothetical protein
MTISSFDDLLRTAAAQAEPQRLLFLFAQKGQIESRSGAAIDRSVTTSGGTLTPVMCVDKGLDELTSFDGLSQESEALGKPWDIVLVACVAGKQGVMPSAREVDQGLEMMVSAVQNGSQLTRFLAFDRAGEPLQFIG